MMALHVGLRRVVAPAGIVAYSGLLAGPERLAETKARPPVLLVHGEADDMIPVEALHMAREALAGAGTPVEWHVRPGLGHGIDPEAQWLIEAAISDRNEPVFFPVGSPGLGAQNCVATNEKDARQRYFQEFVAQGRTEEALRNLLLRNTTGIEMDIIAGQGHMGEIKLISSVTLEDVLGPFSRVDFLEADIQQSEIVVFPPYIDLLKRKVRRIHLGTHGPEVHRAMHDLFADKGWEIVFSFAPETAYETPIGGFRTNDGILSVVNPEL
jgi:hypothetical protein